MPEGVEKTAEGSAVKSCFLNLRIASGAVSWEARGDAAASILGKLAAVLEFIIFIVIGHLNRVM